MSKLRNTVQRMVDNCIGVLSFLAPIWFIVALIGVASAAVGAITSAFVGCSIFVLAGAGGAIFLLKS